MPVNANPDILPTFTMQLSSHGLRSCFHHLSVRHVQRHGAQPLRALGLEVRLPLPTREEAAGKHLHAQRVQVDSQILAQAPVTACPRTADTVIVIQLVLTLSYSCL